MWWSAIGSPRRPPAEGQAAIETIAERSSLLYRADAFRTKELAANVDQIIIVFASRPSFNLWFIWKALLASLAAGIEATVIRNKTDLAEGADVAQAALQEIRALGWHTLAISARGQWAEVIAQLTPITHDRCSLLVGQSGMGKSTLLNLLVPDAQARTREFSERLNQRQADDDGRTLVQVAGRWRAGRHSGLPGVRACASDGSRCDCRLPGVRAASRPTAVFSTVGISPSRTARFAGPSSPVRSHPAATTSTVHSRSRERDEAAGAR